MNNMNNKMHMYGRTPTAPILTPAIAIDPDLGFKVQVWGIFWGYLKSLNPNSETLHHGRQEPIQWTFRLSSFQSFPAMGVYELESKLLKEAYIAEYYRAY